MIKIPTIDLSSPTCGLDLVRAFRETGFCRVRAMNTMVKLVQTVYGEAEIFFNHPLELKMQHTHPDGQVGYVPFGTEHAKDSDIGDLKEFYHVKNLPRVGAESMAFAKAVDYLYVELLDYATIILRALDEVLNTEMTVAGQTANTVLRLLHYPPIQDAPEGALRAAPHEDINLITLLPAATDSGLELKLKGEFWGGGDRWLPVSAEPGEIIVNVGDMLQNITNGLLPSTTHRVVNGKGDKSRYSMPFFVHPDSGYRLDPKPWFCLNEQKYPNITAGEYLETRLREIGLK